MVFAAQIVEYDDYPGLTQSEAEKDAIYEDLVYFHKKEDAVKYLTDRMESDALKKLNENWGIMSIMKKAKKQGLEDRLLYRSISQETNIKQKLKTQGLYNYLTITKDSNNYLQHELKTCYKGDHRVIKKLADCILVGMFQYKIKEIEIR